MVRLRRGSFLMDFLVTSVCKLYCKCWLAVTAEYCGEFFVLMFVSYTFRWEVLWNIPEGCLSKLLENTQGNPQKRDLPLASLPSDWTSGLYCSWIIRQLFFYTPLTSDNIKVTGDIPSRRLCGWPGISQTGMRRVNPYYVIFRFRSCVFVWNVLHGVSIIILPYSR